MTKQCLSTTAVTGGTAAEVREEKDAAVSIPWRRRRWLRWTIGRGSYSNPYDKDILRTK